MKTKKKKKKKKKHTRHRHRQTSTLKRCLKFCGQSGGPAQILAAASFAKVSAAACRSVFSAAVLEVNMSSVEYTVVKTRKTHGATEANQGATFYCKN